MKYLVTHILNNKERKQYERQGLYCYDLRDSDFGSDIASIEKRVIVNRVGSMITNEEIKLGNESNNNFFDYNTFTKNNHSVGTIEELLVKDKELDIRFIGIDNWDRLVFEDKEGNLYKDIMLGEGNIVDTLYTVCNNDFYGEPDSPINKDLKVFINRKINKEKVEAR